MTMNSSSVMDLTWYSAAAMEIWEAMDFGGGLGEVELLYPAKTGSELMWKDGTTGSELL